MAYILFNTPSSERKIEIDGDIEIGRRGNSWELAGWKGSEEIPFGIEDGSVSRRHACIYTEKQAVFIRDMGSKNGTFCNGELIIAEEKINQTSEIQIGRTVLKIIIDSQQVPNQTIQLNFNRPSAQVSEIDCLKTEFEDIRYTGELLYGDIYHARQNGSPVALIIPKGVDDGIMEDFFLNGLQKWKQLKHRNIVKLIQSRLFPVPHLITESITAQRLSGMLQKSSMSIDETCRIIFDIATGMQYAHNRSIYHGQIIPENILIDTLGEAKITQFCLPQTFYRNGDMQLFTFGSDLATHNVSVKSDVHQLGRMFYWMLTGEDPIKPGDAQYIVPPSELNPKAASIDDIILKCLSHTDNYKPSMRQLREGIYDFMKIQYGEELSLSVDLKNVVNLNMRHAFYAAKCEDLKECIASLHIAKEGVRSLDHANKIQSMIQEIEFRREENIGLSDEFLNKFDIFLRFQQNR